MYLRIAQADTCRHELNQQPSVKSHIQVFGSSLTRQLITTDFSELQKALFCSRLCQQHAQEGKDGVKLVAVNALLKLTKLSNIVTDLDRQDLQEKSLHHLRRGFFQVTLLYNDSLMWGDYQRLTCRLPALSLSQQWSTVSVWRKERRPLLRGSRGLFQHGHCEPLGQRPALV